MMTNRRIAGMTILFLIIATATILIVMGRPPICTCGTISLWHGAINSSQDSQQLSDWYSFSHIIHGFLFFGGGWLLLRRYSVSVRLAIAVALESGWEILENSPIIIDRYRTATIALGYNGDSVLNSMSDIGMMMLGFLFASRAPLKVTVLTTIAFELFTLWAIRDNLTLNILMLATPIDAIRVWQAGA